MIDLNTHITGRTGTVKDGQLCKVVNTQTANLRLEVGLNT